MTNSFKIDASCDNFLMTNFLFSVVPSSATTVMVISLISPAVDTVSVAICLLNAPASILTVASVFSVSAVTTASSTE